MKTLFIILLLAAAAGSYAINERLKAKAVAVEPEATQVALDLTAGQDYFTIASIPSIAMAEAMPVVATRSGVLVRNEAQSFNEGDVIAEFSDPSIANQVRQGELALERLRASARMVGQQDSVSDVNAEAALSALDGKIALVKECTPEELATLAELTGGTIATLNLESLLAERELIAAQMEQRENMKSVAKDELESKIELAEIELKALRDSATIKAPFGGFVQWKIPFNSEGKATVAEGVELGTIRKLDGFNLVVQSNDARLAEAEQESLYYEVRVGGDVRYFPLRDRSNGMINGQSVTAYNFEFGGEDAKQYLGSMLNGSVVAKVDREYYTVSKMNLVQVSLGTGARDWRSAARSLDGYKVLHEGVSSLALIKE